jgi:mono/diheme cytochrome c family protein
MWATNLKVVTVALVVVLFYTAVAHLIPQLESAVPEQLTLGPDMSPVQLAGAGQRIYNGVGNCASCHGLGTRAPNLLTGHGGAGSIGARCLATFGPECKQYLYTSLTNPSDSLVAGFAPIMPDMRGQLQSENEIWALVAYLESVGGEITTTAADLTAGSLGAGEATATAPMSGGTTDPRTLLQERACLGCHQLDRQGPPLGPAFDGIGARLSADEIRDAILDPNATVAEGYEQYAGMMPQTFGQQLTAAQLEAMVRFLAGRR